MAHDISQKRVHLHISDADKRRVKDSLLVILVFIVGLIGSCYILHIALSQQPASTSGYEHAPHDDNSETEVLYLTSISLR